MRKAIVVTTLAFVCAACSSESESASSAVTSVAPAVVPTGAAQAPDDDRVQTLGDNRVQTPPRAAEREGEVVVNAVPLDEATRQQIERAYGVPIRPGRYWYDQMTGVWGVEGGPSAGRVAPGLRLGGSLRADASRGDTGVFVNGRELHQLDVQAVRRCTQTVPGRYWVAANGIGGYEGGPPLFDLNVLCAAAAKSAGMQCEDYGNGQFNCGRSGSGTGVTGIIGEGGGQAGIFTDKGLIMTPN
jgi:hypothetical protein